MRSWLPGQRLFFHGYLYDQQITRNAFPSWKDSLLLRSKSEGTGSLDQMSYRS
jgi:hypothetical protein